MFSISGDRGSGQFRASRLVSVALLSATWMGCAGTLDTVTSRRFRERPFHTLFISDDPIEVINTAPDTASKVRAIEELREPAQNGGSKEEQDHVVQFLATCATTHSQVYMRLAAISALSRFKDPRASEILVTAFHNAPHDAPKEVELNQDGAIVQASRRIRAPIAPVSSFTPDNISTIQGRVLASLGESRSPAALDLLCEIALKPVENEPKKSEIDVLSQVSAESAAFDLRLAAVRALHNYKGEPKAIQTLYTILAREKQVALRSLAQEGLVRTTGKDAAPNAEAWAAVLGPGLIPAPAVPPAATPPAKPKDPPGNLLLDAGR